MKDKMKNGSPIWFPLLIWKGVTIFLGHIARTMRKVRRWLVSKDGAVFLSAFTLVLILGAFWILDALRTGFSVADEAEVVSAQGAIPAMPDPVVARIGVETMRLNDVLEFARQDGKLQAGERLSAAEAIERGLVEDAINQTLLARAAADDGLVSDPEVRAKLTAARNRILAAAYLESQVADNVTEDMARELYQAQRRSMANGEEIRLRELVVADAQTAMEISASLNAGLSFEELIANNSIAESVANGGDLGYRPLDRLPDAYVNQAGSLSAGLYTLPFETEAGWVILKVEGRQRITPPAYAQVEDELMEFLRLRTIDTTVESLRERSRVEVIEPGSELPAQAVDTRDPATLRN
ncbi:peptidylprolyl isomerase [Aquisalinus flavus]|uniref:Parvulin-like PPIase n=1 Tax=Aquisalinus flavus TaxID=1526572 RepID=A0A8J2V5P4_9PROT|nr:peptidylprolyl isomerase [Aquisalinus flavus]MBD0427881.1 peptidyl-prolyl cis-trans isomerase [Aquisalinus flavus]UNE47642.1 hypothetical protein FF099_06040 [Aquisalinus flavus]GGD04612.1 peptidylprolyl isomerase [Aquisalinus flavus]